MDSLVTVRFYQVVPAQAGQASFEACLTRIKAVGDNPGRKVDETIIQATNLLIDGDRLSGDLGCILINARQIM